MDVKEYIEKHPNIHKLAGTRFEHDFRKATIMLALEQGTTPQALADEYDKHLNEYMTAKSGEYERNVAEREAHVLAYAEQGRPVLLRKFLAFIDGQPNDGQAFVACGRKLPTGRTGKAGQEITEPCSGKIDVFYPLLRDCCSEVEDFDETKFMEAINRKLTALREIWHVCPACGRKVRFTYAVK